MITFIIFYIEISISPLRHSSTVQMETIYAEINTFDAQREAIDDAVEKAHEREFVEEIIGKYLGTSKQ